MNAHSLIENHEAEKNQAITKSWLLQNGFEQRAGGTALFIKIQDAKYQKDIMIVEFSIDNGSIFLEQETPDSHCNDIPALHMSSQIKSTLDLRIWFFLSFGVELSNTNN
ncbi:MAG: hypothetical protein ACPGXZ_00865 [Saprospiraceae bacterium]